MDDTQARGSKRCSDENAGKRYQDINAETIDRWVANGWTWGQPISHEEYTAAKQGVWQMVLTPKKPIPREWFPPLEGCRVLGLASGGGQQMPVLAALGAICTVLDYSPAQIAAEKMVAEREGYKIECVQADMTQPLPLDDESFDLIVSPVSFCYVREIEPIWRECARVLAPGGLLLSGLDLGINYVVDDDEERIVRGLPFDPVANPSLAELLAQDDSGMQFSHTLAEELGGMLRAGFEILDLFEDVNSEGRLAELGIPSFIAVRARRS